MLSAATVIPALVLTKFTRKVLGLAVWFLKYRIDCSHNETLESLFLENIQGIKKYGKTTATFHINS